MESVKREKKHAENRRFLIQQGLYCDMSIEVMPPDQGRFWIS